MIQNNNDNRGVTTVIGFVLVFAITITFLTLISATFIPELASNKESQTNDKVYSQMYELSGTILDNADTARRQNVLLDTQTTYLFADLGPIPKMNFKVDNSQQLEYEISGYNGSEVFLNGKSGGSVTYESDKIQLTPVLSRNSYSSMGLEHTIVHQDITAQQNIVNNDTIFLPVINAEPNGFITGTNLNVFIDTESYNTTTVDVNSSDDFEIRLETQLDQVAWNNSFEDEIDEGYVNEVRYVDTADTETNDVIIDFESDRTYTIKQAESDVSFR